MERYFISSVLRIMAFLAIDAAASVANSAAAAPGRLSSNTARASEIH